MKTNNVADTTQIVSENPTHAGDIGSPDLEEPGQPTSEETYAGSAAASITTPVFTKRAQQSSAEIGLIQSKFCDSYCTIVYGCLQFTPFQPDSTFPKDYTTPQDQQHQQKVIYDLLQAENTDNTQDMNLPSESDFHDVCVNMTFQKVVNILGMVVGLVSCCVVYAGLVTGDKSILFKVVVYLSSSLFVILELSQFCDVAILTNTNRLFKELKPQYGASFILSIICWLLATVSFILILLGINAADRRGQDITSNIVLIDGDKNSNIELVAIENGDTAAATTTILVAIENGGATATTTAVPLPANTSGNHNQKAINNSSFPSKTNTKHQIATSSVPALSNSQNTDAAIINALTAPATLLQRSPSARSTASTTSATGNMSHMIPSHAIQINRDPITGRLGSGSFGEVHRATYSGESVVVKSLKFGSGNISGKAKQDFHSEARLLAKLRHPRIVRFYGVVDDDENGFGIVME
ncbi:hypothetical protein HDU76_003887, partial [Blyttiomyces sp. JEL0837]